MIPTPAHQLLPGQHFVTEVPDEPFDVTVYRVTRVNTVGDRTTIRAAETGKATFDVYRKPTDVLHVVPAPPVLHNSFIPSEGKWYSLVEYAGLISLDLVDANVFDGDTEEPPVEQRPLQVGDRVRITAPSIFNDTRVIGLVGTVVEVGFDNGDGYTVLVDVTEHKLEDSTRQLHKPETLVRVEEDTTSALRIGDRVRILPGATSSAPSAWQTPPVGTLATVVDTADHEGDIYLKADERFQNPRRPEGVTTLVGWSLREGLAKIGS